MSLDNIAKSVNSVTKLKQVFAENESLRNNPDFLFALLDFGDFKGSMLQEFSDEIRNKASYVKKAISSVKFGDQSFPLNYASDTVKDNEDVAIFAIKANSENIQFVSDRLKADVDFLSNLVATTYVGNSFLTKISNELGQDRDFVLILMKKDPASYQYISETLKGDLDVVWSAMFDSNLLYAPISVYEQTPDFVRQDKDFYAKVVEKLSSFKKERGHLLNEAKRIHTRALAELKGATELLKADLKNSLKHFKKEFKGWSSEPVRKDFLKFLETNVKPFSNDKAIMKQVITVDFMQNSSFVSAGQSYDLLSDKLRNDKAFTRELMKSTESSVYGKLPIAMKSDHDFLKEFFSTKIKPEEVPAEIRRNKSFILELLELHKNEDNVRTMLVEHVSKLVSNELWSEKEFVLKYLPYDGFALEKLPITLRGDIEIVRQALSSGHDVLHYADEDLLVNKDLIYEALRLGGYRFIPSLPMSLLGNKEFMLSLVDVSESPRNFARDVMRVVPLSLKKDLTFCLTYVGLNGWGLEHADESIKYDKSLLQAAFNTGCHVQKILDMKKLREMYTEEEVKELAGNVYQWL